MNLVEPIELVLDGLIYRELLAAVKSDMGIDLGCSSRAYPEDSKVVRVDCREEVKPDALVDFNTDPLPFVSRAYAFGVCFNVINYVARDRRVSFLREARRVLREGSVFLFSFMNWWAMPISSNLGILPGEGKRLLVEAGFKEVEFVSLRCVLGGTVVLRAKA